MAPLPALLFLVLLWPAVAGARRLTVATWDLGWLTLRPAGDPALPRNVQPKRPEDLARLARYAAALHADVVAFQGADGLQAAQAVFPPAEYVLHLAAGSVLQRSGFAVRRGWDFRPQPDDTALDPYPGARLHLRGGADIALRLPDGGTLRLLSVQLKSGCRDLPLDTPAEPACATLRRQAVALHAWIAARQAEGEPFLVLGDFARVMDDDESLMALLARPGTLLRATRHYASPCWGGSNFVDHIIAGGAARAWLRTDSLQVMAYRETGGAWRDRLSAHCPVSVRLELTH